MKVYISPSDQWSNIVAGGQHSEAKHCTDIANTLANYLRQNEYEVKVGDNSKESTYTNRALESNKWGADLHICIHTNAGGGKGTLVLTYPTSINDKYVQNIYNEVANLTPTNDKGIQGSTDLYEINETECVCVYIEVDFHDNLEIEKWIDENTNNIAKSIAKGICSANGKPFNGDANKPVTPSLPATLYKVQVGAFKNGRNAEHRVKELFSVGVPSFYYFDSSTKLYKVQAGAYSKKENAEEQVRVLKNKGFNSFITQ